MFPLPSPPWASSNPRARLERSSRSAATVISKAELSLSNPGLLAIRRRTAANQTSPFAPSLSQQAGPEGAPPAVARFGLTASRANARNRRCKTIREGYERDGRSLGAGQFTGRSSCLCGRQLSERSGGAEGRDEPDRRGSRRGALCRPC